MIYHRKAETVRAIQIKDYSPATVSAVKEFTGAKHVEYRRHIRAKQEEVHVIIRGTSSLFDNHIHLYRGDWLVRSELTGWCKYRDREFKQRFEEGEHGQQSGDGVAEGL